LKGWEDTSADNARVATADIAPKTAGAGYAKAIGRMRGKVDRDASAAPECFTGREISAARGACKIDECSLKLRPGVGRRPAASRAVGLPG
jgi:hypothetical protein